MDFFNEVERAKRLNIVYDQTPDLSERRKKCAQAKQYFDLSQCLKYLNGLRSHFASYNSDILVEAKAEENDRFGFYAYSLVWSESNGSPLFAVWVKMYWEGTLHLKYSYENTLLIGDWMRDGLDKFFIYMLHTPYHFHIDHDSSNI